MTADQEEKNAIIKELKEQYAEIARMLSDYMDGTDNLDSDTVDSDTISEIKSSVSSALTELEQAKEKLDDTENALKVVAELLDIDMSDSVISQDDISKIKRKIEELNKNIDDLTSTLSQKEEEITKLKEDSRDDKDAELDALKGQITDLEKQNREYVSQYAQLVEALKEYLQSDIGDSGETNPNEITNTIKQAMAELSEIRQKLDEQNQAIDNLCNSVLSELRDANIEFTSSSTDKVEIISEAVKKISDSYYGLKDSYDKIETDYDEIIKYIYGEDTDGSTKSVNEIKNQIEKIKQDAVSKAVKDALDDAQNINNNADEIQKAIADAINIILNGGEIDIDNLPEELTSAFSEIDNMRTKIAAMQEVIDGYSSLYSTIKSALGLDDIVSEAQILASIQGLKNQVERLSEQLALAGTEDTDQIYQTGYNAGYILGLKSGGGTNNGKDYSSQITALTTQIKSLTKQNTKLVKKNDTLASKIKKLTGANTSLQNKVSTLVKQMTVLQKSFTKTQKSSSGEKSGNSGTGMVYSSQSRTDTGGTGNIMTAGSQITSASNNTSDQKTTTKNSDIKDSQAKSKDSKENKSDESEILKNGSIVASTNTVYQLGTSIESALPSDVSANEVDSSQKAETIFKEKENSGLKITTDAESYSEVTKEQRNNAYRIIKYYMNHLKELGELGSEDILEAAEDESKIVNFDVLASINVKANANQKKEMEKTGNALLTIRSEIFKDNELYFVVHESDVRKGIFDVLLCEAKDGKLSINLPDFSPVTITKISITDNDLNIVENTESKKQAQLVGEDEESDQASHGAFRAIMYVLIVIVVGGLAAIFFLMKRKKNKLN